MTTSSLAGTVPAPPSELLTTGWEPELPAGDTLLRRYVLHLAEYQTSAAQALGGRVLRTDDLLLADLGRPSGLFNAAVLLSPPTRWSEVLDRVEAFFHGAGTGEVQLWSAWPTPDLRPRGWALHGHPPLLIRAPGGRIPPEPAGLEIAEVVDGAGIEDWNRVAVQGYPFAELQPYRPGCLFDARILADRRWRFWVGYDEGRPVAIGTLFVAGGLAQMALAVTVDGARGRGWWHGMLRRRMLAAPDLVSAGVFADASRPGAERLGYLPLSRFTLWYRTREVS